MTHARFDFADLTPKERYKLLDRLGHSRAPSR